MAVFADLDQPQSDYKVLSPGRLLIDLPPSTAIIFDL